MHDRVGPPADERWWMRDQANLVTAISAAAGTIVRGGQVFPCFKEHHLTSCTNGQGDFPVTRRWPPKLALANASACKAGEHIISGKVKSRRIGPLAWFGASSA